MTVASNAPGAAIPQRALEERLRVLGIDSNTRYNLALLRPWLKESIAEFVNSFYAHMLRHPEIARIFGGAAPEHLKSRQRAHWLEMFECRFDDHYVMNAMRIGRAHFEHDVPPRLYLAGHNFFHCAIIELAANKCRSSRDLPIMLASVAKVIALDVDLAMSAYTRAFWTSKPENDSVWI
jgi:heme-based aerotactic transducer